MKIKHMLKKQIVCIVCIFISLSIISNCIAASSQFIYKEFENCRRLTNKDIMKALSSSKYASWEIYQPTDSEMTKRNIYTEKWFKSTSWFPVIAHRDNQIELVLLQRVDNKWLIVLSNSYALKKDDYYLNAFTVIADSYEVTGNVEFGFHFGSVSNPSDWRYQYDLYLKLGDENCFSDFFYRDPTMQFFSPIYGTSLHIDRLEKTATYGSMTSPDGYSLVSSEYVLQDYSIDTRVDRFDLSTFPICIENLFKQKKILSINDDTLVYSEDDITSSILCTIPPAENVYYYPNTSNWWLVIYDGKIGYVQIK